MTHHSQPTAAAAILVAIVAMLALAVSGARAADADEPSDKYGGSMRITGTPGQSFHIEKIGKRWWLVTPDGHGTFIRAVSKVDVADYGGTGGFRAYDAVYIETADGARSPNLAAAAENSLPRDVIHPAARVTLQRKGDALYLGSSRFKPGFTYFWLDRLGTGGRLQWYYSTAQGWRMLEPGGKPHKAAAPGAEGSWSLDAGGYMGPDENGFGKWENPAANRITWWDPAKGLPADFAAVALPKDPVRRHYLKAVVERDFTAAPVVNQVYERADLEEEIARKYGPGDYAARWARAVTERLRSWGFNAAGQYSGRYVVKAPGLADRLPVEPTWALGGWATDKNRPYKVKNVYAGAVFPPGSKTLLYQGLQPDVFEPGCEKAYRELVAQQASAKDAWSWALIPEEADYLFGIDSLTHDHMGYVVLSQNPYQPRAGRDGQEIAYGDPRLYAKYALRDFLRDRYRAAGDASAAFSPQTAVPCYTYARSPTGPERAALDGLNAAWGTGYTTWDTSAGDLLKGDNAWATGTGFMDENGRTVVAPKTRSIGFDKSFTDPAHPAVRKDLDDFIGVFAARFGVILQKAFAGVPHPVLLLPIYNGPDSVYKALGPYVDGFWVNVPRAEDALRVYNAGRKPVLVADYLTATPDSALHFKAKIQSLRYDASTGNTTVTAPDLRYVFRLPQFVSFPDCVELKEKGTCGGKHVYPYPRVKSVRWNTVEVPGDFTGGVRPGMSIEKHGSPDALATQANRARAMVDRYEKLVRLRGDDGMYFVIGIEHWCLYDPAVSNWVDSENFGLATFQDNAYDGAEARRATGSDARGRPVGGEDADYGDLLGDVGKCLRRLSARILAE